MNLPSDPYREWDVAYVLGALSPSDRRLYEHHLNECETCACAVASFAGMPGILSAVPRERAAELLRPTEGDDVPPPATLLRGMLRAAKSARRRARIGVAAALIVAALGGGLVATRVLPSRPPPEVTRGRVLTQTMPSPVAASVMLVRESWGTRIEVTCTYAKPAQGPETPTFTYALYVEDGKGLKAKAATWTAGPGTTTTPTATIDTPLADITHIQIHLVDKDIVLLEANF